MSELRLSRTSEALKEYDNDNDKLLEMLDLCENDKRVLLQLKVVEAREHLVKLAYYNDTKSINSKYTCMCLHIGPKEPQNPKDLCFVRRMVKKYGDIN